MISNHKYLTVNALFKQKHIAGLVLFRILFGLIMTIYLTSYILNGQLDMFNSYSFHFTFIGFEFLTAVFGQPLYFCFGAMIAASLLIATGFYYRIGTIVLFLLWTGFYFLQKEDYNNHYFLTIIITFLMILLPANRFFSLDIKFRKVTPCDHCPSFYYYLFIYLVGIVYIYAALNKLYPDWLALRPIKMFFLTKPLHPITAQILNMESVQYFIAYGGILYDGTIFFLLLNRKTRLLGFILSVFFNLFNAHVFGIGYFPFLMIALSFLFFDPVKIKDNFFPAVPEYDQQFTIQKRMTKYVCILFFLFFSVQLLLPLRHHFFDGDVHWTEEGHRMSWQMMLRHKKGTIEFLVRDNHSGDTRKVNLFDHLSSIQIDRLATRPDFVWQYVQFIKSECKRNGQTDVSIFAVSNVSLNGKSPKPLIMENFDLAEAKWDLFSHSAWITKSDLN